MKEIQKVDLGSIQIHKHVIADIAANAIKDVKGLSLAGNDVVGRIQELLGIKKYSGISVFVDKNNQVIVEIKVCIAYGLNIPDVAAQAQDLVREVIERTVDIDLKDVNINIRGIERGGQ